MRTVHCCAIGLIGGMLAGCSNSPVLQSIPAVAGYRGMVYALPKAHLHHDAVQQVVSAQDLEDASKTCVAAGKSLPAAGKAVVDAKSVFLQPLPPVSDHCHRYAVQYTTSMVRYDVIPLTVASGMLTSSVGESGRQARALPVKLTAAA